MRAERERKSREREQAETAARLARSAADEDVEMMATGDSIEQAMLEMASPMEDVNGGGLGESKHAADRPGRP